MTFAADAFFDVNKAVLKPEAQAKLRDLVSKTQGVNLEVIIAVGHTDSVGGDAFNQKLSIKRSEAVKAFLLAFTKGAKEVMAKPDDAIQYVKARDGIINEDLELRRLKLALDATVLTPDAKAEGFGSVTGPRLSLMASQVADAYATKGRINPDAVWNGNFLPGKADLAILPAARK